MFKHLFPPFFSYKLCPFICMYLLLSSLVFDSLIYFYFFVQIPHWKIEAIFQSLSVALCGGGPSQSGAPRILSRVRKCPQCSQHLPSVTSPTACYWALSSATKTLQTDLKTSFNRMYQLKKSWSIFEGSSLYHISHTMFLQQSVPFSSLEKDSRKMQPRMRNYINRECDSHLWNLKSYF